MAPISSWYIRTAWIWLAAAWLIGALLALGSLGWLDWRIGVLQPTLYHMVMVGWATQLIWGVAIWLFPLASRARPRGNERLLWLGYAALNSGLVLRCVGEPLLTLAPGPLAQALVALAALLLVAAIWLVGVNLWPRIRPKAPLRGRNATL